MRLYTWVLLPVVVVGLLQLSGCSITNTKQKKVAPPVPGGVYRSTSAGAYFDQSVQLADQTGNISSFRLLRAYEPPFSPSLVYVAAGAKGIVWSKDDGQTWTVITTPLVSTSDVVLLKNGVLIAAGADRAGQGYVIRSNDSGKSWESVLTIPIPVDKGKLEIISSGSKTPQAVVITIAPDPFVEDRVYAGTSLGNVFAGEQSGKTWRTIYSLSGGAFSSSSSRAKLAIDNIIPSPNRAGELLVITADRSLYRVDGASQTQLKIPRKLTNQNKFSGTGQTKSVLSAAYVPGYADALFIGTDDGAVVSNDRGKNWIQLDLPVDTIEKFNSSVVAVSPTNPRRMFVAINSVVYRSEDGGFSWNTFTLRLSKNIITDMLIDPANPSQVLAITTPAAS